MDVSSTVPSVRSKDQRTRNIVASIGVAGLASAVHACAPYNQNQLGTLYGGMLISFTGAEFLIAATLVYMAVLLAYYLAERIPRPSKSLIFFRVAGSFLRGPVAMLRRGLSPEDRVAVLTTLLKAFFAPLMVMSLMIFLDGAINNGLAIARTDAFASGFRTLFDRHGFWFLFQLILFVDVLVFTVGYLVEIPSLKNEIRSVDPTLLGWMAALMCYPPFNTITGAILGSPVSDFPKFEDPLAHLGLNFALLVLMTIYASASVALGFKASNLTHRGIVARGPYALVRHPAYVCKNLAWWIGAGPLVTKAFALSWFSGVSAVASVIAWSMVYVLRALTEEDHLRSVDGEYAAYAAKVRYRFIPGIV